MSDEKHVDMGDLAEPPKRRYIYFFVLVLVSTEGRIEIIQVGPGVQVRPCCERASYQAGDNRLLKIGANK